MFNARTNTEPKNPAFADKGGTKLFSEMERAPSHYPLLEDKTVKRDLVQT